MRRARLPRQKFNSPREFLKRHSYVMGARCGRSISLPLSLSREREIPRQTAARLERIIYCVYFVIIYYTLCIRRLMHMCWEQESSSTHTREHKNTCIYIIYECVSVCFDVVKRHIIQAAIVPFMER